MSLGDLYAKHNEHVRFVVIYIREAHPKDGWDYGDISTVNDPTSIAQRRELAKECGVAMKHGIKTYVDKMDDRTMRAYAAFPERLYLIGTDGKVVYRGGLGPMGFSPQEFAAAIEQELSIARQAPAKE